MQTNFDIRRTSTSHQNERWQPVSPAIVKQSELRSELHENGFAIIDFASMDMVERLREVYQQNHSLEHEDGGMFYSVYSRDIDYRRRVHNEIRAIIQPSLHTFFQGYKNVLNGFVVKASGTKSGFMIHQDSTAVNEFKYTSLTVWIALQNTDSNNGCINLVPKSHLLASPYRAITIPEPHKAILNTVAEYLQPIHLKAGQALLFDQRIIHNSSVNESGEDRLAIISGLIPENAELMTCYKAPGEHTLIEIHKHSDQYLLENPKFFHDCHDRPEGSEIMETINYDFPDIDEETFLVFCDNHQIKKGSVSAKLSCIEFISEPMPEKPTSKSISARVKSFFR